MFLYRLLGLRILGGISPYICMLGINLSDSICLIYRVKMTFGMVFILPYSILFSGEQYYIAIEILDNASSYVQAKITRPMSRNPRNTYWLKLEATWKMIQHTGTLPGAPFTKWFNLNPSMDNKLHPLYNVGWNYLSFELWEWMSNFFPHFTWPVTTYSCWD